MRLETITTQAPWEFVMPTAEEVATAQAAFDAWNTPENVAAFWERRARDKRRRQAAERGEDWQKVS